MDFRRQSETHAWASMSTTAAIVRFSLIVVPLLIGWTSVRLASTFFFQPAGWLGFFCWMIQAVLVAVLTAAVTKRIADRFAPMSALLKLSLVFPDTAPSRFGLALRMGSTRNMKAKVPVLDEDIGVAAKQAIELVVRLGHHERKTRGHVERVRAYGELIGAELGITGEELEKLRWALLLHDVGKLHVPAEILSKDGAPTDEEWLVLKGHPGHGAAMLEPLRPWLGQWIDAAGSHHEKWSGEGYPAGLTGTQIPLGGRICAVADAYDVMTSNRSYKKAGSHDDARAELVRSAGGHFDPDVVRAMLRVGIGRAKSTSMFGWLLEVRGVAELVGRAAQVTVAPVALTAGIVAGTAATIMNPGLLPESGPIPENVAFSAEESSSSSSSSSTTTAEPVTAQSTTSPARPTTEPLTTESPGVATTEVESTTTGVPGSSTTSTTSTTTTTATTTAAPTTTVAQTTNPPTTTTTTAQTTTTANPPTTTTTTAQTTTTTTAPTTTTTAPPTGDVFVFLGAGDMPPSLAPDQYESANTVPLFLEASSYTLTAPLTVRDPIQGAWRAVASWEPQIVLPAGTVVCSWFFHADPVPGDSELTPSGTFPSTVLGYVGRSGGLSDTDFFAVPGVDYSYSPSDAFDYVNFDGADFSASHRSFSGTADQMRIFTAC